MRKSCCSHAPALDYRIQGTMLSLPIRSLEQQSQVLWTDLAFVFGDLLSIQRRHLLGVCSLPGHSHPYPLAQVVQS